MKKSKVLKRFLFLATLIITIGVMAACGSKTEKEASDTSSKKEQITIATAAMPRPFTYVDESGKLVGYDIELAEAVFSRLPQYKVKFQKTEFPSVLAGLDSGMYQLAANNFALNKERQEKYIYSDPTFENQFVIAVAEDNNEIKSFADIAGKSAESQPGVNYTTALENFNKEHADNPVKITYTEAEILPLLQNVENGKNDFNLLDAAMLKMYQDEFGLKLKTIPLTADEQKLISENTYSYFLISKGAEGEKLAKEVNKALKEVIEDGTVSEISQKYFKGDFAPKVQ